MLKRLFWVTVVCALLIEAYVQETGKGISSLPEPLRTFAQSVQTHLKGCSSFIGAKLTPLLQCPKLRGVQDVETIVGSAPVTTPQMSQPPQSFTDRSQASGFGTVIRILADDKTGRQHQKFILKLASGQTLLISHNIDIAKRLETLSVGDAVSFYGEYASNSQGGVIHWTHRDPKGRHPDGWLKYKGKTYQ